MERLIPNILAGIFGVLIILAMGQVISLFVGPHRNRNRTARH